MNNKSRLIVSLVFLVGVVGVLSLAHYAVNSGRLVVDIKLPAGEDSPTLLVQNNSPDHIMIHDNFGVLTTVGPRDTACVLLRTDNEARELLRVNRARSRDFFFGEVFYPHNNRAWALRLSEGYMQDRIIVTREEERCR